MSEGPISQWWKSHEPEKVSTPNSKRVCYKKIHQPRAYCGRKPTVAFDDQSKVTCSDCLAAMRADGVPVRQDSGEPT